MGSYPRTGWGDSISDRNVDREGAAMNHSSKPAKRPKPLTALQICQKELAEVRRQRAAISEVLRAIASSPHDLQPIFDTVLDSAVRLCRADSGTFRLVEKAGYRLVAHKQSPAVSEEYSPPMLRGTRHLFRSPFGRQVARPHSRHRRT